MQKHISKLILLFVLVGLIVAFFAFDLEQYFTLDALKENRQALEDYYARNTGLTLLIYFLVAGLLIFLVVGIFLLIGLVILQFICIVIASIKADKGEFYRYPFTIRFIT